MLDAGKKLRKMCFWCLAHDVQCLLVNYSRYIDLLYMYFWVLWSISSWPRSSNSRVPASCLPLVGCLIEKFCILGKSISAGPCVAIGLLCPCRFLYLPELHGCAPASLVAFGEKLVCTAVGPWGIGLLALLPSATICLYGWMFGLQPLGICSLQLLGQEVAEFHHYDN